MRNRIISSLIAFAAIGSLSGAVFAQDEVTILYTNDVHTYINNFQTDDDGNTTPLLRYSSVAALRQELTQEGKNVLLVDAGDHSQGTAFGGLDEGASVIEIMNAAGYQLATLGNHEFDYGLFRAFAIMDEAEFPYISSTFYSVETGEPVLPAYEILEAGDTKVAFIGISTPETITKSTPTYFMDETGENFIYGFASGEDGTELYEAVQKAIDKAKEEADYVIALGHLGIDPSSEPYRSVDVIANTSGLDAFIDGHSHSVLESEEVVDKDGNSVLLTQTGCYLGSIGEMTIAEDGTISTKLITEYDGVDEEVQALEDEWIGVVDALLGEQIAVLDTPLYINNPDNPDERLIRRQETNLGDFVSDAIYYYFNEELDLYCDVAISNGGGIRSDVEAGDVTYLTAKTVNPFGNVICLTETTGQHILDALEKGAAKAGTISEEGQPAESGGFIHVAGMTYEIDTTVESTIEVDDDGMWKSGPGGEYRVQNVKIYNQETGEYEDLDTEATYYIAGVNYILRNQGDGMSMFKDDEVILDYVDEDYLVLSAYLMSFEEGEDGIPHVSTENSPLAVYENYLLDYENPNGSGRIAIK